MSEESPAKKAWVTIRKRMAEGKKYNFGKSSAESAKKAWRTMNSNSPAKKAWYTRRRKQGAKKGAQKIKNNQWLPEKVDYLLFLDRQASQNTCVVCGDNRYLVLQSHHVEPRRIETVNLCANCHDLVRRGTLSDLKKAHDAKGSWLLISTTKTK